MVNVHGFRGSFIRFVGIMAGVWGVSVFAHAQVDASAQAAASAVKLVAFGERFSASASPAEHQSKVVVYRRHTATQSEPVNIYLDGRYHTSLLKGGYSGFCMSPDAVLVRAVANDAAQMHTGKQAQGQVMNVQPGQTVFLRVPDSMPNDGADALVQVPAEQALSELPETAQQIHTLSRSPRVKPCEPPTAPKAVMAALPTEVSAVAATVVLPVDVLTPSKPQATPLPEPSSYALAADDLFEFGKADLKAEGEKSLDLMVNKLKQDFRQLDAITVLGHTDAIGPDSLNQKLSQARAVTVVRALQQRGITPVNGLKAEGVGSRHLINTRCGNKPTPANKLCQAPNRRVEVSITGMPR